MNKWHLLFFCLCLSWSTSAQVTIQGQVLDEASNEPLVGASLYQQGVEHGTVTAANGEFSNKLINFSLPPLPKV